MSISSTCFQFVAIASMSAFVLAATETHVETEYWKEKMTSLSPVWGVKTITNTDLKRAQNGELIQVCVYVESRQDAMTYIP